MKEKRELTTMAVTITTITSSSILSEPRRPNK
jgi:hypothetical protein